MPLAPDRHNYKEVRLQQLRSFCETARLGSLSAAARSLGLSQPTVWEHVHTLEREFKAPLIESHRRGCRLTAAGRLLVDLAGPVVAGVDTLAGAFQDQFAAAESRLTVAAPQRVIVEDLFEVVGSLQKRFPLMRLRLLERVSGQVAAAVESGEADLGVSTDREPQSPRLRFEPAYELSTLLVTSKSHPLARKKKVTPRDLKGFPLINGPNGFTRPEVSEKLRECGAFEAERHVEAMTTAVVRRYVELSLGVGLVFGRPKPASQCSLHERCMDAYFDRPCISFIWRKGVVLSSFAREFEDTVKKMLRS